MEYVELHCHSNFSFLDGAAHPEQLIERAAELGYQSLALTDHNGLYGVVQFSQAAKEAGLKPIFGSEVTLADGSHLTLLVKDAAGYSNLSQLLSRAQLAHKKGEAKVSESDLERYHEGLIALSGCVLGKVPSLLLAGEDKEAATTAQHRHELFGTGNFYLELTNHNLPLHEKLCGQLRQVGEKLGIPLVATNNVHYTTPKGRRLQDVLTCVRNHTSLDQANGLLYPNAERYLKSADEMAALFALYPEAINNTVAIAARCNFSLDSLETSLPAFKIPARRTPDTYLRELTYRGAKERYGEITDVVVKQLEHELGLIEKLNLAGYFLIVWDIARFCREQKILAQGRGSAANSAVCYCLGVTAVDPIRLKLLFERFLSEERAEPPDIDIDIANNRREEVIQYVYQKYGREHAAMVCEVISYRGRSAVREVGKALGFSPAEIDRLAKLLSHFSDAVEVEEVAEELDLNCDSRRVQLLIELVREIHRYPRHLGIHSGGMIITAKPLSQIVPVENATMANRSVIQWDKDDVADVGLVKIDLLGLGMLSLIDIALKLIEKLHRVKIDPAKLDYDDPKVYDFLCTAETVGIFQVESRAQMNTLPRLKPRHFYDLVVEVALIRPGPIQGEMVHPYLRRRNGEEEITYPHPALKPILERTMGVPLFQEQGMQVAIAAAGFTATQADQLRRAMSHKRSYERMEVIAQELIAGMVKHGIEQEVALRIYKQLTAFADYGFPESHSASFALLVYISAYLKVYYAPEFYCSLLNAQPLGFYSPATIIHEAKRRGVETLPVDLTRSLWDCTIESGKVRLGFSYVKKLGETARLAIERELERGPFKSLEDFVYRTNLDQGSVRQLASVGAFDAFGINRRQALWRVLGLVGHSQTELPLTTSERGQELLPEMQPLEFLIADFQTMDLTTGPHLMKFVRQELTERNIKAAADLTDIPAATRVQVAGVVIIRQRPGTAKGFMFITLEDETGFINIVVKPDMAKHCGRVVSHSQALYVVGELEKRDGVINVIGRRFAPLEFKQTNLQLKSRDFH